MERRTRDRTAGVGALPNVIGERGEIIFELAITDFLEFEQPLFKPGFLGERWPAVDYYIELVGVEGATPFFFAQIKTTTATISPRARTLPIDPTKRSVSACSTCQDRPILLGCMSRASECLSGPCMPDRRVECTVSRSGMS